MTPANLDCCGHDCCGVTTVHEHPTPPERCSDCASMVPVTPLGERARRIAEGKNRTKEQRDG